MTDADALRERTRRERLAPMPSEPAHALENALRDDLVSARRELALYRTMVRAAMDQLHAASRLADRQRELLEMAREERERFTRTMVQA